MSTASLRHPPPSPRASRRTLLRAAGAAAACLAAPALAQPGAVVKITVGYPPGGLMDAIARVLAQGLERELRRTVIVENRPGAGARLAASLFKRQPADGTNLMLATDSLMVHAPHVFTRLGFDVFQDFTPVAAVSSFSYVLATGPDPRADSLGALAEWLRASPDRAAFGHPGAGSAPHFFGLVLGERFGVPLTAVPYQGGAPLLTALASGGQIAFGVNALASDMLEFHRSGRTRIQAVTGDQRSALLPDVPTFGELGYPSVPRGWSAIYLPHGAAAEVVSRLNEALQAVLAQQEVRERIAGFGMQTESGSAQRLARLARADYATWKPIIEKSGFKLDS